MYILSMVKQNILITDHEKHTTFMFFFLFAARTEICTNVNKSITKANVL